MSVVMKKIISYLNSFREKGAFLFCQRRINLEIEILVLVHNTIHSIKLFITYLERAYKYDYFEYGKHTAEMMIIREKY